MDTNGLNPHGSNCFSLEVSKHVAHLVLARPNTLNSMCKSFWGELKAILEQINRNADIRVIVLSSTGKHFSAGMDLSVFADGMTPTQPTSDHSSIDHARRGEVIYRLAKELQDDISTLEKVRIPVIAAIHGGCIGGAVDMITACDIRLASEDAFFCIQEVNLGMAADVGTLQRLPKIIPDSKMREMAYTGRRMGAQEAKECGLISEKYASHEDLYRAAKELAAQIAIKSPVAIYGTKAMLNYSRDHSVQESLEFNALWSGAMLSEQDITEQLAAQKEQRAPSFHPWVAVKKFAE